MERVMSGLDFVVVDFRATCGTLQSQTTCGCRCSVYTVAAAVWSLSTFSSTSTTAVSALPGATCGTIHSSTGILCPLVPVAFK